MPKAVRSIFGEIVLKDQATKAVNRVDKSMSAAKATAVSMNSIIAGIGGAIFLKQAKSVADNIVGLAADFEQTTIAFEVMLGSAEDAKVLLEDIDKLSLATPFEPTTLNEAAKTLLNFNIAGKDIIPTLTQLGDISGGNAIKMKSLSLVFGQIASTGKLMGQDLLQLINVGFNPLQEISRTTGKSIKQLKIDMSKGLITFDMVKSAFTSATSEGGKFNNMMEKQSGTALGLVSTLKGFRDTILRTIGQQILIVGKPLVAFFVKVAKAVAEFTKTEKGVVALRIAIIALVPVIGVALVGALIAAAKAAGIFNLSMLPILAVALAIGVALAIVVLVVDDLIQLFKGGESVIGDFMGDILGIEDFGKQFRKGLGIIKRFFSNLVHEAKRVVNQIKRFFGELPEFIQDIIKGIIPAFGKGLLSFIAPGILENIKTIQKSGIELKTRAKGGPVQTGKSFVVGEEGPEIFTPRSNGFITPNGATGTTVSMQNLVGNMTFNVSGPRDAATKVRTAILAELNELSRTIFRAEMGLAQGN